MCGLWKWIFICLFSSSNIWGILGRKAKEIPENREGKRRVVKGRGWEGSIVFQQSLFSRVEAVFPWKNEPISILFCRNVGPNRGEKILCGIGTVGAEGEYHVMFRLFIFETLWENRVKSRKKWEFRRSNIEFDVPKSSQRYAYCSKRKFGREKIQI